MTTRPEPGTAEWDAYLAEGNAKQARKRVSADVLFLDEAGRVLLVKPTYKEAWDLPGGMAEANESPQDAARRELHEELGLAVRLGRLLCVDWVPPHGPWDDQLAFIFDGGTLDRRQSADLHPRDHELSECAFFAQEDALLHLPPRIRRRAAQALHVLAGRRPGYLEDGDPGR
ncbi:MULTISPECIES: NUDIX hydrolase [unclassified Streptomyces]|uniref:NUDIX domain-containing protein n=1 Tax=unclassified Streptomyces TaxID=2593676 RepID=UPI001BE6D6DB|nr:MULTISPECIES: NUDIX hydrolase [unclassified Streptomyces]MBT2408041.1 NUDIX hydrolase [Streptomyces sp. ISL-21]MBT2611391.1 NUDIX hydrolase [Streptomyces sp. ISL-87]